MCKKVGVDSFRLSERKVIACLASLDRAPTRISTLKAFANSSPGLSSGNPGIEDHFVKDATLKELRRWLAHQTVATPSELRRISRDTFDPGFQSNPWAEISERFQR
jgi:hypothetical protein